MTKRKVYAHQQDLFLHDMDKQHWVDVAPSDQTNTVQFLAHLLLTLSRTVSHGGLTCKTK